MGLLPVLEEVHYPIERFALVDEKGTIGADISYPRLRRTVFGDRHLNFMRGDLARVLYDQPLRSGIDAVRNVALHPRSRRQHD